MNRKYILSVWMVLLLLAMTACSKTQNAASGLVQESNVNAQITEPTISESTATESLEAEKTESEGQDQSDTQIAGPETQDNSEINEASDMKTESSAVQEDDAESQEKAAETEGSREEAVNDSFPVYGSYYYDVVNVVLYLEAYDELPPNYITKNEAQALGWEGGSVEKYKEGAAIGGDRFGNREELLPTASGRSYTECDIDTNGYSSRGSRRLVFSNDGLYFYTSDHYESFSEVTVTEDYEVLW